MFLIIIIKMGIFTGTIDLSKAQDILSTTVLPKLWEWVTMTKEYVLNLWGRYINFEIVIHSLWVFISLLIATIWAVVVWKMWKKYKDVDWYKRPERTTAVRVIWWTAIIFWIICFLCSIISFIQWIYIPEIPLFKELVALKGAM